MCNEDMLTGNFEMKEESFTDRTTFKPCGEGLVNRKFKDSINPEICTSTIFDLPPNQETTNGKKLFIRRIGCCG